MKKEGSKEGKRVKILTDKQEFEGILIKSYDIKIVLLKLSSGYNIGIEKAKIKKIQVLEKKKKEEFKPKLIKPKAGLPGIAIIVTGGTIASRLDYETGGVKALTKPEEIIAVAPKIQEIAKITTIEIPFTVMSEDITSEKWKKLAKLCERLLNKKENKGLIILHGTDTLHYTAAILSFMLQDLNKPVVLTYAQRSIDRGSSDSLLNLTCSAHAALSDIAEVMLIGHATTNDNFCFALRGTKVRKMHTSRRDTFRPINTKPIATIHEDGKIEKYSEYRKRNVGKVKANLVFDDRVSLIKFHPNSSSKIIDFYRKQGYKGLVIEATGLGHVSTEGKKSWLEAIKRAVKSGMIVCFAPQCLYGSLNPFVYSALRKLYDSGVLFLKDMLPETAYVKLGFLLGKERNKERVKELMLKNLVGEYNPRLTFGDFLV
ncbi:MAG: Glu-tRNA(Gln) amidotransferase subunit GatD [Candidatus Pacearchaeota archaeon]|nr:MAG: Glu-tRNA(Gln) amidotransferase subunit GatD [Candidatus Pacearchaeota archaeon]